VSARPSASLTWTDPSFTDPWTKDAVYNALGLAAAILQGCFDFNSFLMTTLANDLQQSSPKYNIVRRRIAILIAQWSCVDIPNLNRPFINQTFQHLLDKSQSTNDLSVRMTAGKQFKTIADAWEFRPDGFVPFAPSVLSALIGLIQEVDLIETKMALLATVTTVVERLEKRVSTHWKYPPQSNSNEDRRFPLPIRLSRCYHLYGLSQETNTS